MADQTPTADELRAIRDQRIGKTLDLCLAAHPFYRERYRERGIRPGDISTMDDLAKLPLSHKAEYMACPDDFRLRMAEHEGASREEITLWNVAYTTGTTGNSPSPFFNTTHDQYTIMLQALRCARLEGFAPGDTIANLIPLSAMPTGGFLVVGRTAEAMGLPVVCGLTGAKHPEFPIHRSLDEAIDRVAEARPSVFWGIPSFVRTFFRRARERNIAFPRARMALVTGEPTSTALQDELATHLRAFGAGDPQVRLRYSFTEMQGGLVQCCNGAAPQNVVPDLYCLEVVDPETGRRMPEGEEGALALTHLHRRGTVFLRHLVGDVVAMRMEPCPHCGNLGERLVQAPRRTGSLVKVKGMLINPEPVLDALSADRAIREHQLVVRKSDRHDMDSMDALVVRIEADAEHHARLAASIPELVRRIVQVRPEVEFVRPGQIYDPLASIKPRRLIDERGETS